MRRAVAARARRTIAINIAQQPLFALVRFFHRYPDPHPRSRELLARWMWRGALMGAHTGTTVQTRQMLAAIGDDEHSSVQALLGTLPPFSPEQRWEALEIEGYSFGYARCKIQLLALLELNPVDVRTGAPVFDSTILAEVSPFEGSIRSLFRDSPDPLGSLAKVMFHPSVPTGLVQAVTTCEVPAWLECHAISDEARRALKFGKSAEFLALRASALTEVVSGFAARRGQWDEADTPPVEALRVASV